MSRRFGAVTRCELAARAKADREWAELSAMAEEDPEIIHGLYAILRQDPADLRAELVTAPDQVVLSVARLGRLAILEVLGRRRD